jgi:cobalamin synthase
MARKHDSPSKWWFWGTVLGVNACALLLLQRYYRLLWAGDAFAWVGLLLLELAAIVVGLACYNVAAAVHAHRGEGKQSMSGRAKKPSRWWFWGVMVAANAYALLLLHAGPYHGVPVWFGLLVLEVVAVVLGLACYGVATLVGAVRSRRGKEGDGSQE